MATGALIGGAVLGGIGKIGEGKANKKAASRQYKALLKSVEASRAADEKRSAAEQIADDALKQANEAFRDASKQQYKNFQATSRDWGAANAERRGLELQNIALGAAERAEKIKRQERANEINEGRAGTRASASGFGGGSSLNAWVDTMVSTNEQDIQWWQEAGASRDALATADANLRFKMAENERAAAGRDALLGAESGEAKYDMYESQREADSIMREADRAQREADRQYALDTGLSQKKSASDAYKGSIVSGIGGMLGAGGGIADSYNKFGWGWS